MAGRFSFSVPERRNASDPWFRIGTLDVGTTVLVILLSVASMVLWAIGGNEIDSFWGHLVLIPDEVTSGQIWRVVTWPLANEPGIWEVITLAIFWYFGREIEGMLGRARFAVLLLLLTIIPGLAAVLLDITLFGLNPVELAVFLLFIAEYPFARFFFGIPAWAIGAVIVGIQVLQYLGNRQEELILLLAVTITVAALTARSMGLATSLPWIPKIPLPGSGGSRSRRSADAPLARRGRSGQRAVGRAAEPYAGSRVRAAPAAASRRWRPGRARPPARQDLRPRHGRAHRRREAPAQRALQAPAQALASDLSVAIERCEAVPDGRERRVQAQELTQVAAGVAAVDRGDVLGRAFGDDQCRRRCRPRGRGR